LEKFTTKQIEQLILNQKLKKNAKIMEPIKEDEIIPSDDIDN